MGTGVEVLAPEEQWYNNKDLYEMMVDISKRLESFGTELVKTQTLIRDYNGLRERLEKCERSIGESSGEKKGGANMWGFVVGGIGLLLAILSRLGQ